MAEVTEYAVRIAGGAMHVRPVDPVPQEDGTPAGWIAAHQAEGVPVYTRTVEVIEDWHEVPRG
jgi:hypothetical protein